MKTKLKNLKTRNPLHGHPLLRKGGVHEKTGKALRKQDKQKLRKEWFALIPIFSNRMNTGYSNNGLVAQRQEHVTVDHEDDGSNPSQFANIEPVFKWLSSRACNQNKADYTLESAGLRLHAVPYVPSYAEWLILHNRKILVDQMAYLKAQCPKHSRLWS